METYSCVEGLGLAETCAAYGLIGAVVAVVLILLGSAYLASRLP